MNEDITDLDDWKWRKQQERLERIMLERYGSTEAELEAFIEVNNEGRYDCRR